VKEFSIPLLLLWIFPVAVPLVTSFAPTAREAAGSAGALWAWGFPLLIAAWVMSDSRKRRLSLCVDYDTFVFFGRPIVVPVYLFRTRGVQGLLPLACFLLICLMSLFAEGFLISEMAN